MALNWQRLRTVIDWLWWGKQVLKEVYVWQEKLDSIKIEIQKLERDRTDFEKKKHNLERDILEFETEIKDCESVLSLIKEAEFEKYKPEI